MTTPLPAYEKSLTVSAAHCNPRQQLTMARLVQEIIDIATEHADAWDVGYEKLINSNAAWVLSRLSVRIAEPLAVKHTYRLTTWVDSLNRHFTRRLVRITDESGRVVAEAVTIWAAIDINTRRAVNLEQWAELMAIDVYRPETEIDFDAPRLTALTEADSEVEYKVEYTDLDFNRHVTTTRYIQLIVNSFGTDFYINNRIAELHVAFIAETRANSLITIATKSVDKELTALQLSSDSAGTALRALVRTTTAANH